MNASRRRGPMSKQFARLLVATQLSLACFGLAGFPSVASAQTKACVSNGTDPAVNGIVASGASWMNCMADGRWAQVVVYGLEHSLVAPAGENAMTTAMVRFTRSPTALYLAFVVNHDMDLQG